MKKMRKVSIFIFLFATLFLANTAGAVDYQIIDLGTLGGANSYAYDINNNGQIVGYSYISSGYQHAFLYQNSVMTDLGTFVGGDTSAAYSINNNGQIVGYSSFTTEYNMSNPPPYYHAFSYQNGIMTDIGGNDISANSINDNGQIVGGTIFWRHEWSPSPYAVLYNGNGTWTGLGAGSAEDINNSGQIVGGINSFEPGIFENGTMTSLCPGGSGSCSGGAFGINNSGQIVGGYGADNSPQHAFLYQNGAMTDRGALGGNYIYSDASDINVSGQIVGSSFYFVGITPYSHALLYENGLMTDLGALVGGNSSWATGINDQGQIAGYSRTSTGDIHAVLWQPTVVPEPISSILFVTGGAILAGRRFLKRKREHI